MIDYSKLSDNELMALKQGNYSALSDDTLLTLKGNSVPTQAPTAQPEQSMTDKVMSNVTKTVDTMKSGYEKLAPTLAVVKQLHNMTDPVKISMNAYNAVQKGLDKTGEVAAEKIGEKFHAPVTGALVGTAISKAPDIAAAVGGIRAAPAIAQGIKAGGSRLLDVAKALVGQGEKGAKVAAEEMVAGAKQGLQAARTNAKGAGMETDELLKLKNQQAAVGDKWLKNKQLLEAEKKAAGEAIGAAEKEAGIGLDKVNLDSKLRKVTRSKERLDNAVDVLDRITARGPEYLKGKDVETLQRARKFAEEGLRQLQKGTPQYARMQKSKQILTEALGSKPGVPPEFAESVGRFRNVAKALEQLPQAQRREAAMLRSEIRKVQSRLRGQKLSAQQRAIEAEKALNEIMPKAEELIRTGIKNDLARKKALYWIGAAGVAAGARKLTGWRPDR